MKITYAAEQFQGPRENQEDRMSASVSGDVARFVLADGMGGHDDGEWAAEAVVRTVMDQPDDRDLFDLLADANRTIATLARRGSLRRPGTTALVLRILGGVGELAHIGDSRAYRWRAEVLTQLTEDHNGWCRQILSRCLSGETDQVPDRIPLVVQSGDRYLLCSDGLYEVLSRDQIERILGQGAPASTIAVDLLEAAQRDPVDNTSVLVVCVDA